MNITKEDWQKAFHKAESDTAEKFPQLCEAKNKDGDYECPMCYMSIRLKKHLGLEED